MASLGIISLMLTNNLIFYVERFKENLNVEKEVNYLANADMYIEERLRAKRVEKIYIDEKDCILIEFWDRDKLTKDKITNKNNKLYLSYMRYGVYYNHVILENVENFKTIDKENLIYVKLKTKGIDERIYCYEK